jgi:hypothetical protein
MRTGESEQERNDRPHGGGESAERSRLSATNGILGRAEKLWRWPESRGGRVPPSWALGVIVALLGWRVGFHPPWSGLDPSWTAGLAMATKEGLHFGTQVVFTYGPLGFLDGTILWYGDLAVLAFLYLAALYVGFSVALVWALRRSLPIVPSVLIAFLIVALLPLLEKSILLAVIVCLGVLERERSQRTINLLVVGGASFAALEALVKLSSGPVVALVFLVAVIGVGARWWQVLGFLGLMGGEILLLWLLAGQSLSAIPDFLENTWQVVSGYSGAAMITESDVSARKVVLATLAAAIITVGLVAASTRAHYRDRRAHWAAAVLMGIAGFAVFKEGVVRADAGHLTPFFSTTCVLWIAIPWGKARWRWLVAGSAVIAAVGVPVRPSGLPTHLNAIANVRYATDQFRTLVSGSRRTKLTNDGRFGLVIGYNLDPQVLADLRGHTVAVEPWEAAVAWAYQLDWDPLPIFQNYQAYTSRLDGANATAVESPTGPDRILRETVPGSPTGDIDNRYPGWDPPAQARAILCNFVPLQTSARWQVLGRTSNRCSSPQLIRSVDASSGTTVAVPEPGRNEVVFVRIYGAGVSGLERLSTLLLHARTRRLIVNGAQSYRLIPGTASDGLLLWGSDRVAEGGAFSQIPQARTIEVTGTDGGMRFSFFRMRVRDHGSSLGR